MRRLIQIIKQPLLWLGSFHARFRWLEAMYPAGLAIFFFACLTYILYTGNRRDMLAQRAEGLLIRQSLKMATSPAIHKDATAVISLRAADYEKLTPSPSNYLFDVHLQEYARLLTKVAKAHPSIIFIGWLSGAHSTDLKYLQPIIQVFKQLREQNIEVYLVYALYEIQFLPPELLESVSVLEGDDCAYEVQSYCSYNAEWKKWAVQFIAERYWGTAHNPIKSLHLSTNLPHYRENYLLNLPKRDSLPQYSFSRVLDDTFDLSALQNKAVFIGNAIIQPQSANGDNELLRRTYIAQDDLNKTFEEASTPMHQFLALLTQMFVDKQTVAVPTQNFTIALTVIFCLFIGFLLWRLSTATALSVFLIFAVAIPFINTLTIKYLNLYTPVFDLLYFGFNTFLFSAFGRLSLQIYRKWRLEEKQKATTLSTDLKSNFLSLMSHNLNTPVAKMQGLLDILVTQDEDPTFKSNMQKASLWVATIQLGIRATLVLTALEEKSVNNSAITLHAFEGEFRDLVGSILKRLNIQVDFRFEGKAGDESPELPFKIDSRCLIYALAGVLSLLKGEENAKHLQVTVRAQLQELPNNKSLTFLMEYQPHVKASPLLQSLDNSKAESFFDDVKISLIKLICSMYGGRTQILQDSLASAAQVKVQLFVQ